VLGLGITPRAAGPRFRPRDALAAPVLCVVFLFGAGSVTADTDVSGHRDTAPPLIVDPSSSPSDATTVTRPVPSMSRVGFIQRMPVGKRVNRVTLGDFGRADGCGQSTVGLVVNEHPRGSGGQGGGDLDAYPLTQVASSTTRQALPAAPGQLTWTIPETTFREGYGYSFALTWDGGCWEARQTTWPHNSVHVNGGPARCTRGPRPASQGDPVGTRMWHVKDDLYPEPNCASTASYAFDPSMPTGWLATTGGSGGSVQSATVWPDDAPPSDAQTCGNSYANAGAKKLRWRTSPGTTNRSDWVCHWPQYAPLHDTTSLEDGWYYGTPWTTGGQPRDAYVKLETIDYSALLATHIPTLLYSSGESQFVIKPDALTDSYVSNEYTNTLRRASGTVLAVADPDGVGAGTPPIPARLSSDFLNFSYSYSSSNYGQAEASDYVDAADEDPIGDGQRMYHESGHADHIFGRVVHGSDGRLWLQYWMFYYYNPYLGGNHEGDWEVVQIRLNDAGAPDLAAYAQHTYGETCPWTHVEKAAGNPNSPNVYVLGGGHASHFRSSLPFGHGGWDGAVPSPPVSMVEITESTPWIAWPGRWGEQDTSPHAPTRQNPKWSDPSVWIEDQLEDCEIPPGG